MFLRIKKAKKKMLGIAEKYFRNESKKIIL
jgi:hypothetical protein